MEMLTSVKSVKCQSEIEKQRVNAFNDLFSTAVSRIRQPIESFFNWLNEKTTVQRAQKVRSTTGLLIHTMGKVAVAFIYLIFQVLIRMNNYSELNFIDLIITYKVPKGDFSSTLPLSVIPCQVRNDDWCILHTLHSQLFSCVCPDFIVKSIQILNKNTNFATPVRKGAGGNVFLSVAGTYLECSKRGFREALF